MKLTKLLLTSTTALGLSMTAAFADGNVSNIKQSGDDNDGLIVQTGSNNAAGANSVTSASGLPANFDDSIVQNGNENNLDILQSGSNNLAGARIVLGEFKGTNFEQQGNSNEMDVTQSGDGNKLETVRQNDFPKLSTSIVTDTNNATVVQSSNNNSVTSIFQIFETKSSTAAGVNASDGNYLSIQQGTAQGTGNGNEIGLALQQGSGNSLTIEQTGTANNIGWAVQEGTVQFTAGHDNEATITLSGNRNGRGLSTPAFGDGYADAGPNVVSADVIQMGDDNETSLDISGNRNDFGIYQNGERNLALGIVVTGDNNSVGSDQVGMDNEIALSTVTGNQNSIGFVQSGNDNYGEANVTGNLNKGLINQLGSDNDTTLDVNGNSNTADLISTGDRNFLSAQQGWLTGTGNSNTMTVTVYGDDNNNTAATGNFDGYALLARNDANGSTTQGFGKGSVWQHGSNNTMIIEVGASGSPSDDNIFAALQQGNGNSITGSITGGDGNQAAVAQLGSNNTSTFNQTGNGNNLGVTQ